MIRDLGEWPSQMAPTYECQIVQGPTVFSRLTDEQWREAFRTGWHPISNKPLLWMQPVNNPDKRVTFEENQVVPKLPQLD